MRRAIASGALIALTVGGGDAAARPRARFEPSDLDLHEAGAAEFDLQFGPLVGDDYVRAFAPDFELSLGFTSHAQLEIDGTFGLTDLGSPEFQDNTLVGLRVGIFDVKDNPSTSSAWAGGVQAGPRLPTRPGSRGLGLEGLIIVGRSAGRMHLFLQGGVLIDAAQLDDASMRGPRPEALEGGLDLDLDLDDRDAWSAKAQLGGAKFLSPDDDQIHLVAGPSFKLTPSIELSALALVGFLRGSDRVGLLLGVSSRFPPL